MRESAGFRIRLINQSSVTRKEMAVVARAINKQLKRDVAPVWDVVVSVTNSTSPGVQCDATMIITDELP